MFSETLCEPDLLELFAQELEIFGTLARWAPLGAARPSLANLCCPAGIGELLQYAQHCEGGLRNASKALKYLKII